eukprot:2701330-Ditylum_brightwellii.AAC.1
MDKYDRNLGCAITKTANAKFKIAIDNDLNRREVHCNVITPSGCYIDNQIFTTDPTILELFWKNTKTGHPKINNQIYTDHYKYWHIAVRLLY